VEVEVEVGGGGGGGGGGGVGVPGMSWGEWLVMEQDGGREEVVVVAVVALAWQRGLRQCHCTSSTLQPTAS
jgi:hypothetical protein